MFTPGPWTGKTPFAEYLELVNDCCHGDTVQKSILADNFLRSMSEKDRIEVMAYLVRVVMFEKHLNLSQQESVITKTEPHSETKEPPDGIIVSEREADFILDLAKHSFRTDGDLSDKYLALIDRFANAFPNLTKRAREFVAQVMMARTGNLN